MEAHTRTGVAQRIPSLARLSHANIRATLARGGLMRQRAEDDGLNEFLEADDMAFDALCAAVDEAIDRALARGSAGPVELDLHGRFPIQVAEDGREYPLEAFLSQCYQWSDGGRSPMWFQWSKVAWSGRRAAFERLRLALVEHQECPVYLVFTDRPLIFLTFPWEHSVLPLYEGGPLVAAVGQAVLWHGRNVVPFPSSIAPSVLAPPHRGMPPPPPGAPAPAGRRRRRRGGRKHRRGPPAAPPPSPDVPPVVLDIEVQ